MLAYRLCIDYQVRPQDRYAKLKILNMRSELEILSANKPYLFAGGGVSIVYLFLHFKTFLRIQELFREGVSNIVFSSP
jgi:hypothetical protein